MKLKSLTAAIAAARSLMKNNAGIEDVFTESGQKIHTEEKRIGHALLLEIQALREMIKAYLAGNYKFSKRTILYVVAGMLYFINPFDLIPDFILGLGFLDDAAILALVFKRIKKEVDLFKTYSASTKNKTIVIQ